MTPWPIARHGAGRYSVWRMVAAMPAMLGSTCLLLVLLGFLGRRESVAMLAWLASAAVVLTRPGERMFARAVFGMRRLPDGEARVVAAVWARALHVSGCDGDAVDLLMQAGDAANAYAAGRRTVAVTGGALREFTARRLSEDQFCAVLVHEIGHLRTGGTRFGLVVLWLTMPWRCACRWLLTGCYRVAGRGQPLPLLSVVAAAGVGVAVVQSAQRGEWLAAGVLMVLAVCAVVCPVLDALISRRAEFAADRFAISCGAGLDLAGALELLASHSRSLRGVGLLLSRHPPIGRRVDALARLGG